jgi:hypothetical protein
MPKIDQVHRQTRLVRWHVERVSGRVLEEHGDLLREFVHAGKAICRVGAGIGAWLA